jgi:hypothetical protein
MVKDGSMTRRDLLTALLKACAGAGMYSFIPIPLLNPTIASLKENEHPYWLEVLSRGIRYYPDNIVSFFSD